MTRNLLALAALAMVAALGAGCSSAPAEIGTGSGGGTGGVGPAASAEPGSGGVGGSASPQTQAVKFAECMRDNGVEGFPDPNASGELTIDGIVNGSSLDPNSPTWTKAMSACRDLEPAGFTGHARSAQQQASALKFAQCIRDNGVKDFPDPAISDPLVDTNLIPSTATQGGMSILNAAMRKCRALGGAAGAQP